MKPYLGFKNGGMEESGRVEDGVNFAVAGVTALDRSFFEEKGFVVGGTANYSLMVQIDEFKEMLPSICNSTSSKVIYYSLLLFVSYVLQICIYKLLSFDLQDFAIRLLPMLRYSYRGVD